MVITRELPQGLRLAAWRRLDAGIGQFRRHPAMEQGRCLFADHRLFPLEAGRQRVNLLCHQECRGR